MRSNSVLRCLLTFVEKFGIVDEFMISLKLSIDCGKNFEAVLSQFPKLFTTIND